ncbi:aldo/keto reductase family protein [Xanthobacter sp. ZOL 2024]
MADRDDDAPQGILSSAGVRMPRLLYGTAWKKERTADLVAQALRAGFRGIDTACQPKHYDEPGVGAGVAAVLAEGLSRRDLYLQTKFTPVGGQEPANLPYDPAGPLDEQVRQSFRASLRNLRTDYLDALILHSPYPDDEHTFAVWRAMESACEGGVVRQLGLSNCYEPERFKRIYEHARIKPALLQNRFYAKTGYDREIRAFCRREGVLYESFWTLTANPDLLARPELGAIAGRHGATPAQAFFRYLTQQDVVCLTGTTSAVHMAEDLAIFDFHLSAAECEVIAGFLV